MAISSVPDPHKPAVYAAENLWQRRNPQAGAELTSRQARKLSKQIINHPALDNVPGVAEARKSLATKVSIKTGLVQKVAPGTKAATNGAGMTLYSKEHPLTVGTVTHETVHKIMAHRDENPAHGPQFSDLHAHVVRNVLGPVSHANLRSLYDRNGVER